MARPPFITVPDLPRPMRALRNRYSADLPAEGQGIGPLTGMKNPCLQGFATLFNKPHVYRGSFDVFTSACFIDTLYDGREKYFLLDHNYSHNYGSTKSNLELERTPEGLAFRLKLSGHPHAGMLASMVTSGTRAHMSIGYRVKDSEKRSIEGFVVNFIKKVELDEITLCKEGVVTNACAWLEDLPDDERFLVQSAYKPSFAARATATNVANSANRLAAAVRRLAND